MPIRRFLSSHCLFVVILSLCCSSQAFSGQQIALTDIQGGLYLYNVDTRTVDEDSSAGVSNVATDGSDVVAFADLNGDGGNDLLLRDANGAWFAYLIKDGEVIESGSVGMTSNTAWEFKAVDDFNGDGASDVILRNSSNGTWFVYLLDGLNIPASGSVNLAFNQDWIFQGTADFDGDGKSDVLLRHQNNQSWYLYAMDGVGLNSAETGLIRFALNPNWTFRAAADFTGDGKADMIMRRNDGPWWMYQADGTEVLLNDNFGLLALTANTAWAFKGVGDFNADGMSDVLLRNSSDGRWFLYALNGREKVGGAAEGVISMTTDLTSVFAGLADYMTPEAVDEALEYYTENISGPVIQERCITCHISGGVAASSGLLYVSSSVDAYIETNFAAIESYINTSGGDLLLSKARGVGHGGGEQLSANSTEYANLETFIGLLDGGSASNTPPVAVLGDDFIAPTSSKIIVDGSGSTDADGDSLSYAWTFSSRPSGSSASFVDSSAVLAEFVADKDGTYELSLVASDGTDSSAASTLTVTTSTNSWLINNDLMSTYITDTLVNVQSVDTTNVAMNTFNRISATGIPDYVVTFTEDDVAALNARPKASLDFVGGATSVVAGQAIAFGESIGYDAPRGCELGYWPPGPACPTDQAKEVNLPANPSPASEECATSINTMGLMLDGTSVYNWSDGKSYNGEGVWQQLAPEFEIYDVDICNGHAQSAGEYHHHMFSSCLAELFSDEGQAHSPIYGYVADGYPIYGPYHAKGVLAKPSWQKRDYSDTDKGGCGTDGERSCLLVDQYDLGQGTTASTAGPDVTETVESSSGNSFVVASGYYLEDFYNDIELRDAGGEYLDEHNGHDHDELGYHYHLTVEQGDDDSLIPAFPYNIGPTFYGDTPSGSVHTCMPRPS